MGWVMAGIASVVLTTVSFGWLAMLWRFWMMRNMFEIKARSPVLVVVSMFMQGVLVMSVLLHWMLLSMKKSLPCPVVFVVSYTSLAFGAAPYLGRAVRLVVAYNRGYREKYVRFVRKESLMGAWMATTLAFAIRGAIFFGEEPTHYSSNARDCFYWDDTRLVAVVMIGAAAPSMGLVRSLSRVHDAFRIKEEISRVLVGCMFCGALSWSTQLLVKFKVLRDAPGVHVAVEVCALVYGINFGVWGLLIPMLRAHRGGCRGFFRGAVVPAEKDAFSEEMPGVEGMLTLVREGGDMSKRFEHYCKTNLCLESWDFLVDAALYKLMDATEADEQFVAFTMISDQYLLATSPDEVNIAYATRKHMAAFRTREEFDQLAVHERASIFTEPLDDIVRMLEHNLWSRFMKHVALEYRKELAQAAQGDKELMQLMEASAVQSRSRPVSE